jgi:hypothetical protein
VLKKPSAFLTREFCQRENNSIFCFFNLARHYAFYNGLCLAKLQILFAKKGEIWGQRVFLGIFSLQTAIWYAILKTPLWGGGRNG